MLSVRTTWWHLNLKFRKILFVHNNRFSCPIILKFCTEQWYCHGLCKISKRLCNYEITYGQMRLWEMRVYDAFRTDIQYCTCKPPDFGHHRACKGLEAHGGVRPAISAHNDNRNVRYRICFHPICFSFHVTFIRRDAVIQNGRRDLVALRVLGKEFPWPTKWQIISQEHILQVEYLRFGRVSFNLVPWRFIGDDLYASSELNIL